MNHKKRHILVAGGAGFLGSHLCREELQAGNYVTCLDSFVSSPESSHRIVDWQDSPDYASIRGDVREPIRNLEKSFGPVTHVYNLACIASPIWYMLNPVQTLMTSVLGMKNVLDFAYTSKAKVLFTSTSEVYGDPIEHPQLETYNGNVVIDGPRSCYDEGKRAAETLCSDYRRLFDMEIVVARLFNTYGPGMAIGDGRVVSNFVVQALKGAPITVQGTGKQTRSLAYVDDTIDVLRKLMHSDGLNVGRPVNVGNSEEVTVARIATLIQSLVNSDSNIVYTGAAIDDPQRRCPDRTRLQEVLGHLPNFRSLRSGLLPTIDYFSELMGFPQTVECKGEYQ